MTAKKERYRGVALDVLLGGFEAKTRDAEQYFVQWYGAVQSNKLDEGDRIELLDDLLASLRVLDKLCPDSAPTIIEELASFPRDIEKCAQVLFSMGPKVVQDLRNAKEVSGVTVPKLGGVTRWCHDKFTCIEFLKVQMPTVAAFIDAELCNPRVSESVRKCAELISTCSVRSIMSSASEFCSRLAPLHDALQRFSDLDGTSTATTVWPMIQKLTRISKEEAGCEALQVALKHHLSRLNNKHNMKFCEDIMWFAPDFITLRAKKSGILPISVDRANDLFRSGNPTFHITENEWSSYLNCSDYEWNPSCRTTELKWWEVFKCSSKAHTHRRCRIQVSMERKIKIKKTHPPAI